MLQILDLVVSVIKTCALKTVTVFQILVDKVSAYLVIMQLNQDKACSVMEILVLQTLTVYQEHVIILSVLTATVLQDHYVIQILVF